MEGGSSMAYGIVDLTFRMDIAMYGKIWLDRATLCQFFMLIFTVAILLY